MEDDDPSHNLFIGGISTEKLYAWKVRVNIRNGKVTDMKLDPGAFGNNTVSPSNLVIVRRTTTLKFKSLNQATKKEHLSVPSLVEVHANLSGKTVVTILNEVDAYWQFKLTEPHSYLCTFNTPWGRKRLGRVPFGICSAGEGIRKRNYETFIYETSQAITASLLI